MISVPFGLEMQVAVLAIMTTSKEHLILTKMKILAEAVSLMKLFSCVILYRHLLMCGKMLHEALHLNRE